MKAPYASCPVTWTEAKETKSSKKKADKAAEALLQGGAGCVGMCRRFCEFGAPSDISRSHKLVIVLRSR